MLFSHNEWQLTAFEDGREDLLPRVRSQFCKLWTRTPPSAVYGMSKDPFLGGLTGGVSTVNDVTIRQ